MSSSIATAGPGPDHLVQSIKPDRTIIEFVRESGLVSAGSSPRFRSLAGGVSSDIWLVSTEHEMFCVKRALPFLRVPAEWQAPIERNLFEAAWYRTVGVFMPESVPKILHEDKRNAMFAMEYLSPEAFKNWKDSLARGEVSSEVASLVGERLARIHAATAGVEELARRFSTDSIFHAIRIEPYLLATARAHPDLAEKLQTLARDMMSAKIALVHGDASPKNILIGPAAPVFIDAECAWYGDPAFDLCFCLNHLLLKCMIVPEKTAELMDAFHKLGHAYLQGVTWEVSSCFEKRAADLLPALLLARIDGKSPVEYITEESQRELVRDIAKRLLAEGSAKKLMDIAGAWALAVEQFRRTRR